MLTNTQSLQDYQTYTEDCIEEYVEGCVEDYVEYAACIDTVQQYILDHIDEPLNREVLAAVANFSVPHLHRIFTGRVGENLATYVRRVRLERAARKLRMGAVDIMEVALAAGYKTHAAFGKAFKQQYGLSPSEFRQLDCATATQLLRRINYCED